MFEYASKHDFVKAGRFQEQYRVLMEVAEADSASKPTAASAKSTSYAGSGGLGGAIASALGGALGGSGHPGMSFGVMPVPVGAKSPYDPYGYDDGYDDDEYYGDY